MYRKSVTNQQLGFTIIELMIALSILSVILIMASVTLIQIGKLYTKGVNSANVQNTARNTVTELASAIQFGNDSPRYGSANFSAGGQTVIVNSFCLDTKRYSYIVGQQVSSNPDYTLKPPQSYHALYADTMKSNGSCNPMNITQSAPMDAMTTGDGRELVPEHMRLTQLKIQEVAIGSGLYMVNVGIAYGDNDLFVSAKSADFRCNGNSGQEFCAVTTLTTDVTRRLK